LSTSTTRCSSRRSLSLSPFFPYLCEFIIGGLTREHLVAAYCELLNQQSSLGYLSSLIHSTAHTMKWIVVVVVGSSSSSSSGPTTQFTVTPFVVTLFLKKINCATRHFLLYEKKKKKIVPFLCLRFKKGKLDLEEDFSAFLPHEVRVSTVTGVDGSGANLMIVANHADRIEQEGHIARTLVFSFFFFLIRKQMSIVFTIMTTTTMVINLKLFKCFVYGTTQPTTSFQGRIAIPLGLDIDSITSSLTSNGRLVVCATSQTGSPRERVVPVFPSDSKRHESSHPRCTPGGP